MTRRVYGMMVIDAALRRVELALAKGNLEEAHSAVDYAASQMPKETLADDAGIGFLGIDSQACDLLAAAGFEDVGSLRRAGYDGIVAKVRVMPFEDLRPFAESSGYLGRVSRGRVRKMAHPSDRKGVAHELARKVRTSMKSFGMQLTIRGSKEPPAF